MRRRGPEHCAFAFAVLAGVLLVASPSQGPDFAFYLDWSDAALSRDIFKLRGEVSSPLGVPLSQWSAGPGLLFALGSFPVPGLVALRDGALAVGSVAALVLWGSLLTVLRRTSHEASVVLFALGAAFLGTHAGFYSYSHASESLGLGVGALLVALLTAPSGAGAFRDLWIGACAALLVLVRAQHVLYAVPALLLAAVRSWRERPGGAERAMSLGMLATPIALAIVQTAVVHRWMTGSLLRSPYTFGGEGFRSLDWSDPELLAVLTHPYHGLLPYHPLYGLGFLALVRCVATAPSRDERVLWGVGLTAVLAHLYLQASWYAWWLGTLTFGLRGMSLAMVVLVPALARATGRARPGSGERRLWVLASTLASVWSLLLMLQRYTHFYRMSDLVGAQMRAAALLLDPTVALALLAGLAFAAAFVILFERGRAPSDSQDRLVTGAAILVTGLSIGLLLTRAWRRLVRRGVLEELRVEVVVVALALVVLGIILLEKRRIRAAAVEDAVQGGLGWTAAASLAAALTLFVGLALSTEERIAAGVPPPRQFRGTASVVFDQVREAYYEYAPIPGFETKKERLLAFLRANGVEP